MLSKEDIPISPIQGDSNSFPTGKTYLFFIAIDKYRNGITPLNNAVSDAKAVANSLLKHYELDESYLKMLFNEKATKKAIFTAFDKYLDEVTDQDNFIFFFSGHGTYYKKIEGGYWLTSESNSGERDTFFPNDEVSKFIKNLKARHVFGIVDACFSGALFRTVNTISEIDRHYNIPSRWLLTSGRLEPVSDGTLGKHSPFAKVLINSLNYHESAQLWISEFCARVARGLDHDTERQLPRGGALQTLGHNGGDFVLLRKGKESHPSPDKNSVSIDRLVKRLGEVLDNEGEKYSTFLSLKKKYNLLQDKIMADVVIESEINEEKSLISESILTFTKSLQQSDLSPKVIHRHKALTNQILILTQKKEVEYVRDFFHRLNFTNIKVKAQHKNLNRLDNFDLIIFDNRDLPNCPKQADLYNLNKKEQELILNRISKMELVLKESSKFVIHLGGFLYWVNFNRNRVHAANSKFALYARTKELIEFINTYRV